MLLIEALMAAPLTAMSRRWPGTFHAAETKTIIGAWPNGTVTAPRGATRLRLVAGRDGLPGLWPPQVKGMLPGWTRCRACHVATGEKRPRSAWVPALQGGSLDQEPAGVAS